MRVYRYFSPDSGLETLQNRQFILRDIRSFNDPFELLPRMNPPTEEEIVKAHTSERNIKLFHEQHGKQLGLDEQQCKDAYKQYTPELIEFTLQNSERNVQKARRGMLANCANGFRLLCCSHTCESILMWSHYAKNHSGIVLEFETNELQNDLCLDFGTLEVSYRTSPPFMPNPPFQSEEEMMKNLYKVMGTKASFWSYEEEVRIVIPIDSPNQGAFPFQPLAIKSVIVGCSAAPEFIVSLKEVLGKSDFKHIELMRAHIHERDYKLDFRPM